MFIYVYSILIASSVYRVGSDDCYTSDTYTYRLRHKNEVLLLFIIMYDRYIIIYCRPRP